MSWVCGVCRLLFPFGVEVTPCAPHPRSRAFCILVSVSLSEVNLECPMRRASDLQVKYLSLEIPQ